MDGSKEEGILEEIRSQIYSGTRTLVLEALKGSAELKHASEMRTICDILYSAEIEFPGYGIDWYWVLQLFPWDKPDAIRAQYQKLVSLLQPVQDDIPGTNLALKLVQDAFSVLSDPAKRLAFDAKRNRKGSNSNSEVLCSISNNLGNEAATRGTAAGSSTGTKRPPHEPDGRSGDVRSTENYTRKKQKKICAQDGIGLCSKLKDVSHSCSAPLLRKKRSLVLRFTRRNLTSSNKFTVHVVPDMAEATNSAAETTAARRAEGSSVSTSYVSADGGDDAAGSSASLLPRWEVIQRRAFLELIKEFVDSLSARGFDDPASVAEESRNHLEVIKKTLRLRVGAVKRLLQRITGLAEELASAKAAKRAAEIVGRVDESQIEEAKARLEELLTASMGKEKEAKAATARERAVVDHIAHLEGLLMESRAQLVDETRRRNLAEGKARTEAEAVSAHRQVVSDIVAHSERVKDQLRALEETETCHRARLRSFVKALKRRTVS